MNNQLKKVMNLMGFRFFLMIILLATALFQFFIMLNSVRGVTYDVELMQLASDTIRANKTVEDTDRTELERQQAAANVEPIYVFNDDIADYRAKFVNDLFDVMIETREALLERESVPSTEEKLEVMRKNVKEIIDAQSTTFNLSNSQLTTVINASRQELMTAKNNLKDDVMTYLANPIREEQLVTARNELEAKIRQKSSSDDPLLSTVVAIGRAAINANELLDEEKMAFAQQQARDAIEPTRILQGQIIVQEGEYVDREIYRQLELLGILEHKSSIKPIVGLILLIVLQMAFLFILFDRTKMPMATRRKAVVVTAIVYSMTILLMKLLSLVAVNFDTTIAYLFPTAMATMLVRLLVNERVAGIVTVMTAASAGLIFHEGYAAVLQMDISLYILFGGFAVLIFLRTIEKRAHFLQACAVISIVNLFFIIFYLLMSQTNIGWLELVFFITAAVVSGFLSGALTMGILPFFETAFGVLSTMRLIELSNPNHPLLKKILTETPGTYHHSLMVANLAEAACEAIDADGLLARVGCYYHDVGKTVRPHYFIENQHGMNPHDHLAPEESARIILAHTVDGARLLREHKMPQEIIDIALQHHGTGALKYFIFKAKESGKEIDESLFRYQGPKPQTKEAAVISIADSVEAAVRSMKEPTPEKVQQCIQSIIQDRVQDNQLDECDVSMRELKIIERALCETLNGIFHSRIEYPKEAQEEVLV